MVTDLNEMFSTNAKHMKKSVIRELLKLTRRPEVISFAGGLPDPAAFPVDEVAEITAYVLKRRREPPRFSTARPRGTQGSRTS